MTDKHQGWVASLSNGDTVFEWAPEPGERSAWGQLQERCEKEGLWITQIQLHLAGKKFIGIKNADGYTCFTDYHRIGFMTGMLKEKRVRGIGSVVGDTVYCLLIDDNLEAQNDVRPLASMLAHCVIKPGA